MRPNLCSTVCTTILAVSSACAQRSEPAPAKADAPAPEPIFQGDFTPSTLRYKVETVVEKVEVPWAIVWTPDGRMWFTERPGRVREFANGTLRPEPLATVAVDARAAEIGLMGMCLHPDFARNKFAYLAFGKARDAIRVVRFREESGKLVEDKEIISIKPAGRNHAGCCLRFGPDGKLYISTGEAFQGRLAQDMTSLAGKILRVNDDGSVPADNPFTSPEDQAKGTRPEVWTFGNRNPQGFDWHPTSGLLFESEHGPSGEAETGGDELNVIHRGRNYGWPVIHHAMTAAGMESPIALWSPALAPASLVCYNADAFPQMKGDVLVGALGGLAFPFKPGVLRLKVEGPRVVSAERLASDYGRIRCVAVGPDGYVYFSTSNRDGRGRPGETDDRIMRLVPAE
jgi:aldose sugar dehydrogenase